MAYNHPHRYRKHIRLRGWDYRNAGAYFVTICTHNRSCIFGTIKNDRMRLNAWGQIVVVQLKETEKIRPYIQIDTMMVMPNHVHIIFWIQHSLDVGSQRAVTSLQDQFFASSQIPETPHRTQHAASLHERPDDAKIHSQSGAPLQNHAIKPKSLNATVRSFKSAVTKEINLLRDRKEPKIWQPRFHDHIIRNERELNAFRAYIEANPVNWTADQEWNAGLDDALNFYPD